MSSNFAVLKYIQESRRDISNWKEPICQDNSADVNGVWNLDWTTTLHESLQKNVANLGASNESDHIMIRFNGPSLELCKIADMFATFVHQQAPYSVIHVYLDLGNADAFDAAKEDEGGKENLSLQLGLRVISRCFFRRSFREFTSNASSSTLYAHRKSCTFELAMQCISQHVRDSCLTHPLAEAHAMILHLDNVTSPLVVPFQADLVTLIGKYMCTGPKASRPPLAKKLGFALLPVFTSSITTVENVPIPMGRFSEAILRSDLSQA